VTREDTAWVSVRRKPSVTLRDGLLRRARCADRESGAHARLTLSWGCRCRDEQTSSCAFRAAQ